MRNKVITIPLGLLSLAWILLFGLSAVLAPIKEANWEADRQKAMKLLLPGSETFQEEVYEGEDTNIARVYQSETGCIVETVVAGYVDDITLLVGVDKGGKVTGIMVDEMNETWGLGQRAMTDLQFLSQMINSSGDAAIGEGIDALSGATVTSKAVVKAVNSAAAYVTGADVSSGATEWGG